MLLLDESKNEFSWFIVILTSDELNLKQFNIRIEHKRTTI